MYCDSGPSWALFMNVLGPGRAGISSSRRLCIQVCRDGAWSTCFRFATHPAFHSLLASTILNKGKQYEIGKSSAGSKSVLSVSRFIFPRGQRTHDACGRQAKTRSERFIFSFLVSRRRPVLPFPSTLVRFPSSLPPSSIHLLLSRWLPTCKRCAKRPLRRCLATRPPGSSV